MKSILNVENLIFAPTSEQQPCGPISCDLKKGQLLWIQGPNGSGKTTFIRAILGMASIFSGSVSSPMRSQIRYLPQIQNPQIPWPITLKEVLQLAGVKPPFSDVFSPEKWDLSWNTASGGERQLVLFIRALSTTPTLLIVDEPFNFLDQQTKIACINLLKTYLSKGGTVVIVEHTDSPPELHPFMVPIVDFSKETIHA